MQSLIRIISSAWGGPSELDGAWLKTYDPDARLGYGEVTGTRNRAEAMRFADAGEAMACWRQVSTVRPRRPDGKPNRPLTAFTIEVERDGLDDKRDPFLGTGKPEPAQK